MNQGDFIIYAVVSLLILWGIISLATSGIKKGAEKANSHNETNGSASRNKGGDIK